MAKTNGVENMNMEELTALEVQIEERKRALRQESLKEILKELYIGRRIKVKTRNGDTWATIHAITTEVVTASMEEDDGQIHNRRIPFEKILEMD